MGNRTRLKYSQIYFKILGTVYPIDLIFLPGVHTFSHIPIAIGSMHLLEEELDILTIKVLLGHESIDTTMIYLNVARTVKCRAFSPLDRVYLFRK